MKTSIALTAVLPSLASASALQWTIHGFDYHASYIFTTPAHQNSWGYVNFNLTNNLVNYQMSCSAASNQLSDFFYGTLAYACTPSDNAPVGAGANFKFSRPTGQLDIEETIPGGETPTVYSASAHITLTCTDKTVVNENWKIGEIYSQRDVRCLPVDLTVSAS